jgi:hypothetical protein
MQFFWYEQYRLAVQTTQLACLQCQLLTGLTLFSPLAIWPSKQRKTDEQ